MSLLQPTDKKTKEQVRLNLDKEILDKVRAYCDWADFKSKEDFIEQAIEFVLKKDRDWRKYQSEGKVAITG